MFAQQPRTFRQSHLRNHEKQHATSLEPAIAMFEEDQFQSLIVALSGFPIVRRIQIKQGHRFGLAPDIHGVSLQSLDSQRSCLFGPIGIDLNAVAMSAYAIEQVSECHAIAHAGIECRELRCKSKAILQPSGFRHGQREKSQLGFSVWSHLAISLSASATRAPTPSDSGISLTAMNEQKPFTGNGRSSSIW